MCTLIYILLVAWYLSLCPNLVDKCTRQSVEHSAKYRILVIVQLYGAGAFAFPHVLKQLKYGAVAGLAQFRTYYSPHALYRRLVTHMHNTLHLSIYVMLLLSLVTCHHVRPRSQKIINVTMLFASSLFYCCCLLQYYISFVSYSIYETESEKLDGILRQSLVLLLCPASQLWDSAIIAPCTHGQPIVNLYCVIGNYSTSYDFVTIFSSFR